MKFFIYVLTLIFLSFILIYHYCKNLKKKIFLINFNDSNKKSECLCYKEIKKAKRKMRNMFYYNNNNIYIKCMNLIYFR